MRAKSTRPMASALAVVAVMALAGGGHPPGPRRSGSGSPAGRPVDDERQGRPRAASVRGVPAQFRRAATYPVFANRPAGEAPSTTTVAEIAAVTEDGRIVVYTDAAGQRLGFLDITDPKAPRGLGTVSLSASPGASDKPTSVAVKAGHAMVVVDTSESAEEPAGRLDVVEIATRRVVRSIQLGGQPDSVTVSPDGRYAAIAVENERDLGAAPPRGDQGDLPQTPPGFLVIVDLPSGDPATWRARTVQLTAAGGGALPEFVAAGIVEPTDPEPEYVSINRDNQIAMTLQENNGIVIVDAPSGRIRRAMSAGAATVSGVDTTSDGAIRLDGTLTKSVREPDGISWIDTRHVAMANEGDWRGGTRGWSIMDTGTGEMVWDAGNGYERLAVRYGLFSDDRASLMGTEPENVAVARFRGGRYAFVGAEWGGFVVVYDLTRPSAPLPVQVLATTSAPEGLLAIPRRDLLVVSSEGDHPEVGTRSTITLYTLNDGEDDFPSLVSASDPTGTPIGWGALSGLSAVPGQSGSLYAVTDGSYTPTRILTIDVRRRPAVISEELVVTDERGAPIGYDAEGIFARPGGGFWLASEGATGGENRLIRLDVSGRTERSIGLPAEIAAGVDDAGVHGVAALTDRSGREEVWVALRRPLSADSVGLARLGRYDVPTKSWRWFGYSLDVSGEFENRTEIAELSVLGKRRIAVVERDGLSGPSARVKRVYSVSVPPMDATPRPIASPGAASGGTAQGGATTEGDQVTPGDDPPVLGKTLALDLLPDLGAGRGWIPEKVEGFASCDDGRIYAVTDNDSVRYAAGETVLLRLGGARGWRHRR